MQQFLRLTVFDGSQFLFLSQMTLISHSWTGEQIDVVRCKCSVRSIGLLNRFVAKRPACSGSRGPVGYISVHRDACRLLRRCHHGTKHFTEETVHSRKPLYF